MNWRRWSGVLGEFPINADRTSEMRTSLYIFALCLAVLLLFVTVDRLDHNRALATLLMILILGIVAAAVLIKAIP
jgi:hypothetical protein